MTLPINHPFRKHSENARAVKKGLTQVERLHKDALRRNHQPLINEIARWHSVMIGQRAESRLRQIVADPGGFNDTERSIIGQQRSQVDRWMTAVDLAFRRHFSVPIHIDLSQDSLGPSNELARTQLRDLLDGELRSVIDDRNKTAHAQWVWHLNSKETAFTGPAPTVLRYRPLIVRTEIIEAVADIVHILVVSEPTFQRDFSTKINRISSLQPLLDGSDHESFVLSLRRTAVPM